jgi:hypothetical protein
MGLTATKNMIGTKRSVTVLRNIFFGGNVMKDVMKTVFIMMSVVLLFAGLPAFGQTKKTASDGARMQTANPKMPTRIIENGTRISMYFGDVIIPGILNDSETARALIKMLPYTVHVSRYAHDFCGVMKNPLPYREEDVHYGWLNGDIDFARDANYFTILFEDEKNSEQYGHQINIGAINCELSKISNLRGNYDVRIVLVE